jgi:glycerophosphoryl diester phosphodiesterase
VREKIADAGLVRRAHARGRKVYAWTVNEAAQMSAMISRGVDVLITDEPALARSVIAQHAELGLVERLLVAAGVRFGLVEDEDEGDEDEPGATAHVSD